MKSILSVWAGILFFSLTNSFLLPGLAADEWQKDWKSQRICEFDLQYPPDALLDIKRECPGMFTLFRNGSPLINFFVQRLHAGDWREQAIRDALGFCSADGPYGSQFCERIRAKVEDFRIDGQRVLKIVAPITVSPPSGKPDDGTFTIYVAELPKLDARGRPRVLIIYPFNRPDAKVLSMVDGITKTLRLQDSSAPSTAQQINREKDRSALDAAALAKGPMKDIRSFEGYVFEAIHPDFKECIPGISDFGKNYDKCDPTDLPASIYRPDKTLLTTLSETYSRHYHPFEIHGNTVLWIRRQGDYKVDPSWTDELWAMDVVTGQKERLATGKGIDFRASPDAKTVMLLREQSGLLALNRSSKAIKLIAHPEDGGRDDGITLLQWSSDNSKFWFGAGIVDGWSKLGVFKDGKVFWLGFPEGYDPYGILEPDHGWWITSNVYEIKAGEEYKKTYPITRLEVIDAFSGKKAILAESKEGRCGLSWDADGSLQCAAGDKFFKLSKMEIEAKLK